MFNPKTYTKMAPKKKFSARGAMRLELTKSSPPSSTAETAVRRSSENLMRRPVRRPAHAEGEPHFDPA